MVYLTYSKRYYYTKVWDKVMVIKCFSTWREIYLSRVCPDDE